MPAKIRESVVERDIVAYAKSKGVECFKFTSPGQRGAPDRVFIKAGRVLFLEIKQKGKKPTPLQDHQMLRIQNAGVAAQWTDNLTTGKFYIDTILLS